MTRRTDLLHFVRSMPEAQLLAAIPKIPKRTLLRLYSAFGPESCACEHPLIPCGCEGCACERGKACDCKEGCLPDWKPCRHSKPYYLPYSCHVLIAETLWPDPKAPTVPDDSLDPEPLAQIMFERAARKEHLRHKDDLIQHIKFLVNHGAGDKIGRPVKRLRNGAPVAGRVDIQTVLRAQALKEGD